VETVDNPASKKAKVPEKVGACKACWLKFSRSNQYLLFVILLSCSEWGDKSQIAAVALAPIYGLAAVSIGGGLGHALCIVIALLFGKAALSVISENTLLMIGSVLFIIFGFIEMTLELILKNWDSTLDYNTEFEWAILL